MTPFNTSSLHPVPPLYTGACACCFVCDGACASECCSLCGNVLRRDTRAQEVAAGAATFTARHTCAGREKNVDGDGDEADGGGGVGEEEDEDEGTGSRRGKDRRRSVSRCMLVLFTGRHF